ncbi:Aldehyde/histidinol dehydrogenase [Lipomyces tetrasporus]|uniref:Aldehyde/histidinol dehydrogenase n=1 Tax=Lipomyces tetrasporus TaxID=54092 RepID=A0AAD7QU60_9ASCO|nr:Aldehyde/histidinol dehydrogenase [Lipomyces tetrasporus]KAJ8101540.1 Aldehyde/histidinol dehydrogenase [Lipomyces tetrasporus]
MSLLQLLLGLLSTVADFAKSWSVVGSTLMIATAVALAYVWQPSLPEESYDFIYKYKFPAESQPKWSQKDPPVGVPPRPSVYNPNRPDLIHCYCPATGQYLCRVSASTKADIDTAVAKCQKAQEVWKATSFKQRKAVLKVFLEFLKKNQEEVVRIACRDSGKTMVDAALGEIMVTLEKLAWTMKYGERAMRPSSRSGPANLLIRYKAAEVVYEPLGVVLALVSWNYPLHNVLNPIVSSIFTGNGIIVKCSESVVWSSRYFVEMVQTCFTICGHSPDLVQLVCPWPNDADYLTSHPDISHTTFIGSKPVAHKVLAAAASSLMPVTVELGGKDAAVILDEHLGSWSNCDAIASVLMRGSFQSAGQNCIGIERIICEPKAYDSLSKVLAKRVPALRLGSSLDDDQNVDVGAMINDSRFEVLERMIADAVKNGAQLSCGGQRYRHPNHPVGSYFQPTLLVDVTPEMEIARNELFAPVMVLMKAENVDDAIRIANSTKFGLGGAVFGKRGSAATEKVVREMKTGNIAVNDFATFYVCQLPFGGVSDSGYGKFGGEEGLRGLCLAKSVCRDRFPGISTSIPPVVDYPLNSVKTAWEFVRAMNAAAYATSAKEFVMSLVQLVGNLK